MAGRRQRVQERAYFLWEADGRLHGNDWAYWFLAETEIPSIRVTFDSNRWQPVVVPDKFPSNPRRDHFVKIQAALNRKDIQGFLSDSIATLEGVPNVDRPEFLTTQDLRARIVNIDSEIRWRSSPLTKAPARLSRGF
jgi:Protein of unknown function (DUF2934)